jgi:hypothetical protein
VASEQAAVAVRVAAPVARSQATLLVAIFAVALLPLLTTPLFPFIDLYNHLARYFVLAHVGDSALLRQDYAANWALLPNIGLDVIGTGMMRVVPPAWSAHLVVALLFAAQYAGVLAFNRALTGRTSLLVALLLVPLLYSYILNWGFANFLLGLGLVFAAAAWWLARRHQLVVALPVACLLAVVIFFTHGLCFALYGILVASLTVGQVWTSAARRPVDYIRALVPVAVQAVVPVLLFVMAPTSASPGGITNVGASVSRLAGHGALAARLWALVCYRLETIVRVAEGPWLWLDVVSFVALVAIVVALVRAGRVTIARAAWPAIAAAVVLVIVVPPALFGVGYVADRMPLFLALLLVGALAVPEGGAGMRPAVVAVAAIVAIRLVAIAIGWQDYAADYAGFRRIAPLIPPGSLVHDVVVGGTPRDGIAPRCLMYRPLLVRDYGQLGALFADEFKQPLQLTGRLRAALAKLPPGFAGGHNPPGYDDDVIARAGPAGFDFLLVCGAGQLTRPLPAGVVVAARTPRLTLLDLRGTRR